MDPRDFHQLATELVRGTRASEFRTAISRAYYAVYNFSVAILHEMGFQITEGPSGHGEVKNRLGNSGNTAVEKVASQISNLYSQRIHADYRLSRTDVENPKTAQAVVNQSNNMLRILDHCCSQNREEIINAIRKWEQKTS